LQELRLENNNISNITMQFTRGVNLEILRIDGNPMTELRKISMTRMRELSAKKCQISTVSPQAFQIITHLRRIDLSDNQISSLSNGTFPRNSELVAFNAASNSLNNIDIVFSNARQLKYLDLNNNYIEDITKALTQLSALSKLNLNLNMIRFIRDETFIISKNLEQLNLRQNKIEWLGANCFKGLLRLYFLDLSNNKLLALNGSTSNLPALRAIYLNENTLRVLKEKDFRNNPELRAIYASRNNITSLERSFRNLDKLRTVWLQSNRLTAVHKKSFPEAARTPTTIEDAEHVVCTQGTNALVSGKLFFRLTQKDLCPSALMQVLAVGLPFVGMLVVIALAMSTFYLKFKRQVKVWLYARGVCSFLQCIKEDDLDEDKLFDVFLSFSSRDSAWAYEQLIPKVEANGFSVCTYDRNFKGGFLLHDIIQEAVSCSRRTLLVLTQNFLDSEWCRWEFRVAHHRALEDKINRLIIVLVNEVNLELVDEELQLYMQSTNYLRWGERHFWDKLIYSLPKKDGKHRLIRNAPESRTTLVSE
ncbi:unnamed protein product, partial [Ixodes hexagonus]